MGGRSPPSFEYPHVLPRYLSSSAVPPLILPGHSPPVRSLSLPAFFLGYSRISWQLSSSRLVSHRISSHLLPSLLPPRLGPASPRHIIIFRSTHSTAQHILPFPSSFLASLPGPTSSTQSTAPYTHFHPTRLARVALRPLPFRSSFTHTYLRTYGHTTHPSCIHICIPFCWRIPYIHHIHPVRIHLFAMRISMRTRTTEHT
jgi:hypothetical protein